mgnify:CR=1 FL=1
MVRFIQISLLSILVFSCDILKQGDMAVYVPDTETFSLVDVLNAVEDHAGDIDNDLDACFYHSDPTYFDPDYNQDSYAPDRSMLRFRNYGPGQGYEIFVPEGFSPNGDGVHDYFEVHNLEYYPEHKMSIFDTGGSLLYQRTNDYDQYPWDGTYNGQQVPAGNYTWVLEISGTPYDSGTVMVEY